MRIVLSAWLVGLFLLGALGAAEAVQRPMVLAHYMAWYRSKPFSGSWGWHWTMNRFDPERVGPEGKREIASHDGPLIGPYDSADPAVLECQALLMKYAGIDGVVIDWYGSRAHNDYADVHRNAGLLIQQIQRVGLRFALCYEDQSVKHMIEDRVLPESGAVEHVRSEMERLAVSWWREPGYVHEEGRPLLLVFGPQYFQRQQWETLFRGLPKRPLLLAMPHLAGGAGADGVFGWPPVSGGKVCPPEEWRAVLGELKNRVTGGERVAAVAFPGFHDIYGEAGLHGSYGRIEARDGLTFSESLDMALSSGARIVQIATWNDYGEGTMIEPTCGLGYRLLEEVQRRLQPAGRGPEDLRLPVQLYQLRKRFAGDAGAEAVLERVSDLLRIGARVKALGLMEGLGR
jgi:hypothetical protein